MYMNIRTILVLAGLLTSTVLAKDHGNKHKPKHWKDHDQKYAAVYFHDDHVRILYDYYQPRQLPPGLQKKLYRTGHLPPGWEKKMRPFPVVVERRMPPLCYGCERGYLDGYAVVYEPRSRLIIDVHAVLGR